MVGESLRKTQHKKFYNSGNIFTSYLEHVVKYNFVNFFL